MKVNGWSPKLCNSECFHEQDSTHIASVAHAVWMIGVLALFSLYVYQSQIPRIFQHLLVWGGTKMGVGDIGNVVNVWQVIYRGLESLSKGKGCTVPRRFFIHDGQLGVPIPSSAVARN